MIIHLPEQRMLTIGNPGLRILAAQAEGELPWWAVPGKTCVAAYQPKGAASYAASKVNLANPGTYDATEGVAPSWAAATGWTFNGITHFLKTGVVPQLDQSWSMIIRTADTGPGYLCGMYNGTGKGFLIWPSSARWYNGGYLSTAAYTDGVAAVAGNKAYLNGIPYAGTIPAGTNDPGVRDIFVGDANIITPAPCAVKVAAFAVYSNVLSAGEVATVSAAMAAL